MGGRWLFRGGGRCRERRSGSAAEAGKKDASLGHGRNPARRRLRSRVGLVDALYWTRDARGVCGVFTQ